MIDTSKIIVSKPKKSDASTYICPTYYEVKRQPFCVELSGSYVIHKSDNGYIHIKLCDRTHNNMFYDIASHIVAVVKSNFSSWFNSQMNEDLVDDYFSHPLVYDKKYGDIIRLKIISNIDAITDIKHRSNIAIKLDHIRIYKQKFQLEWSIEDVTYDAPGKDNYIQEDSEDEEEIGIPIEEIREEYIAKITTLFDTLNTFMTLLKTADKKEVVGICERVSEFLDAVE